MMSGEIDTDPFWDTIHNQPFMETVITRRVVPPKPSECSHCKETRPLKLVEAMTAYAPPTYTIWIAVVHDDYPPDPNPPQWLCEECEADHNAYWTAMWDEYHASRG